MSVSRHLVKIIFITIATTLTNRIRPPASYRDLSTSRAVTAICSLLASSHFNTIYAPKRLLPGERDQHEVSAMPVVNADIHANRL